MIERCPVRHQIRVRDENTRSVQMGAENSNWLARLNQQRLITVELTQGGDDPIKTLPVAGCTTDSAVDHELARPFGNLRIQVVHQHAQRRFREPAPGTDLAAARGSDRAVVVQSAIHEKWPFSARIGNGLFWSAEIAAAGNAPASTSAAA